MRLRYELIKSKALAVELQNLKGMWSKIGLRTILSGKLLLRRRIVSTTDAVAQAHFKEFYFIPDVISLEEEKLIMSSINPMLKRKKYEDGHWDAVIKLYKEMEVQDARMPPAIKDIFERVRGVIRATLQDDNIIFLPTHVIDLDSKGDIGAHVDSVKFSGDFISGLSLLSSRILRQSPVGGENMTEEQRQQVETRKPFNVLLPPRSLYIFRNTLRYEYDHAILGSAQMKELNITDGPDVSRRVSLMFRDIHPSDRSKYLS